MANTMGLIAAGSETTTHAISHSILDLLDHPEELERLQKDPTILPHAVEELLRHIPFGMFGTVVTTTEVELGGKHIPAGQVIFYSACATNHDPGVFPDPDRLDLGRQNVRHLSFGLGPRHCLGAALARMELQVAIGTLVRRLPGLRLKGLRSDVKIEFNMLFRGIPSLPVTW
jgi:cytochrome P450